VPAILPGLPVANHPQFPGFWDRYAHSFNTLAAQLEEVQIDISLLRKVVNATQDLERLSFDYTMKNLKGEM